MDQVLTEKRELLLKLRKSSEIGGGEVRIKKQHEQNKYTARERIDRLVDPGTFLEFDRFVISKGSALSKDTFLGDGVVTGIASINGQKLPCTLKTLR